MGSSQEVVDSLTNNTYEYSLGRLFDRVARHYSDRTALVYSNDLRYTYLDLQKRTNAFTQYFLSSNLRPGSVIAIFNDKSINAISIMLACLELGIIYTNLDANSPAGDLKRFCNCNSFTYLWGYKCIH